MGGTGSEGLPASSELFAGESTDAALNSSIVQVGRVAWLTKAVPVALCVSLWYSASVTITFTNKFLLTTREFHYPFFMCALTNACVSAIAFGATRFPRWRASISRRSFLHVGIIGLGTAVDIGTSNWSLEYVSVAFHVILKGTIPLFVLIFALVLRIERPSRRTPFAVTLIVGGLVLTAYDRMVLPDRPLGLVLGLLSSACAGMRWAFTQLLMRSGGRSAGTKKLNPLGTLLYVAPVCAVAALPFVAIFERDILSAPALYEQEELVELALYLIWISILVTVLQLAEFHLVQLTSSLTLSIFGLVKELATVTLSALLGDVLSPANIAGLLVCVAGTALYQSEKHRPPAPPSGATHTATATQAPLGRQGLTSSCRRLCKRAFVCLAAREQLIDSRDTKLSSDARLPIAMPPALERPQPPGQKGPDDLARSEALQQGTQLSAPRSSDRNAPHDLD